jgi:hypothetical protein
MKTTMHRFGYYMIVVLCIGFLFPCLGKAQFLCACSTSDGSLDPDTTGTGCVSLATCTTFSDEFNSVGCQTFTAAEENLLLAICNNDGEGMTCIPGVFCG